MKPTQPVCQDFKKLTSLGWDYKVSIIIQLLRYRQGQFYSLEKKLGKNLKVNCKRQTVSLGLWVA